MGFKTDLFAGIAGVFDPRAEQAVRDVVANITGDRNAHPSGGQQAAQSFPPQSHFSSQNDSRRFVRMHHISQNSPSTSSPYNDSGAPPFRNGASSESSAQTRLPPNYWGMRNEDPGFSRPSAYPAAPHDAPVTSQQPSATTSSTPSSAWRLPPNYMEMRNEDPGFSRPSAYPAAPHDAPVTSQQPSATTSSTPSSAWRLPPNYMEMRNEDPGFSRPSAYPAAPHDAPVTSQQPSATTTSTPSSARHLPPNYMAMRNE